MKQWSPIDQDFWSQEYNNGNVLTSPDWELGVKMASLAYPIFKLYFDFTFKVVEDKMVFIATPKESISYRDATNKIESLSSFMAGIKAVLNVA